MLRTTTKQSEGFTLIELMMVLALSAIVLTMAVPSFSNALRNNKVVAETNELIADINFARSEAVKRSKRVVLCRSASPSSNTPSCGGNINDWKTGWLVFVDDDLDDVYNDGFDTLIRIGNPASGTVSVKTNAPAYQDLIYNPDGTTNEGGSVVVFAICDDRGENYGRQLQINATGRPRMITPIASCTNP